ncbi:saccharopine dehydrogenase NADP-binding domain-containing protein [Anaerovorax odorimutans]|uniref:Saccharopine dehydrogenase NADP-binding domain-containing protein n=1 Tax=Anaerovorax odorimutans TaxID=109327 RepID=A0ABT1RS30_9FIRM|nr:saccharopine dehydrogenase NADP-binding domain-containing protein [Anaerovorax odorimutans]MCQ4638009.1 saccharopine dehydrogenase NADP-binding domain-containing protein [Anaerovorax odorimutans]
MMKLIILGAGIQGSIVATDLCDKELSPDEKDVTICDYDFAKAREVADRLGIKALQCDVSDHDALISIIKGADVVLNCVQYNWNIDIMRACLVVGAHYVDLGGLFHVTKKQFDLHEEFKKAGLTAVLGMGSTPGTMNVMAGYAASRLDTVREAHAICACGDFTRTEAIIGIPYSLLTVMEEHTMDPWILKDGKLQPVPAGSGKEMIPFSEPIGLAEAFYCIHSEPAQFARSFKEKGIQEASFKLSLPEAFEERIRFLAELGFSSEEPLEVGGQQVNPLKTMVGVVNRYLSRYDDSNDGQLNDSDVLRAVVKGTKDGVEKEVIVESVIRTSEKWGFMAGALDTGVPPSIVAQMICKGQITERGALAGEQCVPPIPYFKELAKREMPVYCVEKTPLSSDDFEQLNEAMNKPK